MNSSRLDLQNLLANAEHNFIQFDIECQKIDDQRLFYDDHGIESLPLL